MPDDLVNDTWLPMGVAEVLKNILMSACSLCCPHIAAFRRIIMLSIVFCIVADVLLQLCLLL